MRFFAQTHKVFNGSQPTGESEDNVDRDESSELQPGKRRAVYSKPQRLADDHIGFGWFLAGEATMKEIDDGQNRSGERDQHQHKKSPAWPDVRECLRDEQIQTAPPEDHQEER